MRAYVINNNGSSNNLPPDSHQFQNAAYWRTGGFTIKESYIHYQLWFSLV